MTVEDIKKDFNNCPELCPCPQGHTQDTDPSVVNFISQHNEVDKEGSEMCVA